MNKKQREKYTKIIIYAIIFIFIIGLLPMFFI
ncbi:hypothetical protein SAMN05428976_102266 [Clostridium sp. USBA 49]|jgi:hypothetical protein|nr:hypothetical protein SAMN05428976_102266 [Clostridium sp. USBA 49]